MRRHLALVAVVAASAVSVTSRSSADRKLEEIDISDVRDKLVVLDDGDQHYVIVWPGQNIRDKVQHFYYGDGKGFFQQKARNPTPVAGTEWLRGFWSPTFLRDGGLRLKGGKWSVTCDHDSWMPMSVVSAAESRRILSTAKFYPPRFQRLVLLLARDDEANYYVVDGEPGPPGRVRSELRAIRLFRGPIGQLKKLKSEQIASDIEGLVVVTKDGTLLLDHDAPVKRAKAKASWKTKEASAPLKILDEHRNRLLLYGTLGIYGRIGTPCDDMVAP